MVPLVWTFKQVVTIVCSCARFFLYFFKHDVSRFYIDCGCLKWDVYSSMWLPKCRTTNGIFPLKSAMYYPIEVWLHMIVSLSKWVCGVNSIICHSFFGKTTIESLSKWAARRGFFCILFADDFLSIRVLASLMSPECLSMTTQVKTWYGYPKSSLFSKPPARSRWIMCSQTNGSWKAMTALLFTRTSLIALQVASRSPSYLLIHSRHGLHRLDTIAGE